MDGVNLTLDQYYTNDFYDSLSKFLKTVDLSIYIWCIIYSLQTDPEISFKDYLLNKTVSKNLSVSRTIS
jgi:hypothetical protein